ncbi:hypothetical protein NBO_519g0001 [Nosema bombycis CQ1]|uniref:Uncharacterized protein n=1 Tax=Nosema bombycis (strain CQ1 / CVCC 102059) TaxID=578461 RepID=R0KN91_NOSB1|nr:hypothetical protein NBO_519g0001 [Nosema bombycis CQ1]|eukprot:EOB12131.1 hypothetical protein NBO_519g0001 [Nosema bombycis CQ1]
MDCKILSMFYFMMVALSRRLIIKKSTGLLCLIANSSNILTTKDQLKSETPEERYLRKNKKLTRAEEYELMVKHKKHVENEEWACVFLLGLLLFINWLFIGFGFWYVFGFCCFLYWLLFIKFKNNDFRKCNDC